MNFTRRILSLVMSVLMVFSVLSITATQASALAKPVKGK